MHKFVGKAKNAYFPQNFTHYLISKLCSLSKSFRSVCAVDNDEQIIVQSFSLLISMKESSQFPVLTEAHFNELIFIVKVRERKTKKIRHTHT